MTMFATDEKQVAGALTVLLCLMGVIEIQSGGYMLGTICSVAATWALFSMTHIDTKRTQRRD
jgi:hypothetical protein